MAKHTKLYDKHVDLTGGKKYGRFCRIFDAVMV